MEYTENRAFIENRTFDEIKIDDSASLARTLSHDDIEVFAVMSGDVNPAHVDPEYARSDMFHKIVAHGMWGAPLISDLQDKRDIVQNAIDPAHVLGLGAPKVAILSAAEMVESKIQSTLDASALCKMADRGQIAGGLVDGPWRSTTRYRRRRQRPRASSLPWRAWPIFWWCRTSNRAICWASSWNTWPRRRARALWSVRACRSC